MCAKWECLTSIPSFRSQDRGIKIPRQLRRGPSSFIPVEEVRQNCLTRLCFSLVLGSLFAEVQLVTGLGFIQTELSTVFPPTLPAGLCAVIISWMLFASRQSTVSETTFLKVKGKKHNETALMGATGKERIFVGVAELKAAGSGASLPAPELHHHHSLLDTHFLFLDFKVLNWGWREAL